MSAHRVLSETIIHPSHIAQITVKDLAEILIPTFGGIMVGAELQMIGRCMRMVFAAVCALPLLVIALKPFDSYLAKI